MDINIDNFHELVEVPEDLKQFITDSLKDCWGYSPEDNPLEDLDLTWENQTFGFILVDTTPWEVETKYDFMNELYMLVAFDKTKKSFVYEDNLTQKYNMFFNINISRTGSYYSDYFYNYDFPVIQYASIEHIPEQIIEAYDMVTIK